jgi:prolyl 4-hydroxylase
LKYDEGQYYYAHDDHIIHHNKQSHGPRLLTFFIYFNEVKKGGGTQFPNLNNLTVQPKKGRVLIWPSITVEEGQKFAANAWIHMRDFQTPFSMGCPG